MQNNQSNPLIERSSVIYYEIYAMIDVIDIHSFNKIINNKFSNHNHINMVFRELFFIFTLIFEITYQVS